MINPKLHLSKRLFSEDIDGVSTRDGYGEGLVIAGEENEKVVVLCADLRDSTRSSAFAEEFPERFIEVGVAEQALATVAAGMAAYGKIPFISSFACFSPARNWEQIRTSICLNNVPVKIGGSHAGVSTGADGATHQALEDIALMRVLPNMVVIAPADAVETKKAVTAAARNDKPTYIRFAREATPVFTTEETPFEIGKAEVLWGPSTSPSTLSSGPKGSGRQSNPEVAIVACGPLVYEALIAAKDLEKENIGSVVINCHTIKPLDERTIIGVARKCGAVVTVEDHQIAGGLGGAVAEVLAKNYPVSMEFIGMADSFGESGQADELLKKYEMKSKDIMEAAQKVVRRNGKKKGAI